MKVKGETSMKRQLFKSILHIFILGALLAALFGFQRITPALAAGAPPDQAVDVKQFLNPDGSLNLDADYNGSLDIGNYGIVLDPAHGPVFKPLMAPGLWNTLGAAVLNGGVNAIAVSGSDIYV